MAITYIGAGGVFTRLGKVFKLFLALEDLQADAGSIATLETELLAEFDGAPDLTAGLHELMSGWRATPDNWKAALPEYAERIVRALADELDAPSDDLAVLWPLFLARMVEDAQTVKANAVSLGAITPGDGNVGTGLCVMTLDDIDGLPAETAAPETVRVECVNDAGSGATADAETFRISGEVPAGPFSYLRRGTGLGGTIAVANASSNNLVLNGDFEDWTDDVPDDWTIGAGTKLVHILKGTFPTLHGPYALKFVGDGALAEISVSQALDVTRVAARSKYVCGCWIDTSGVTAGTIHLTVTGTGFAPATQKIEISSAWPTPWTFYSFFLDTPAIVPDVLTLTISVTGTLNNAAIIRFDGLAIVPAAYHHGIYWAVFEGAAQFVLGDRWTCAVANDLGGEFQTMFGRLWNVQLPSDDADGETIADTLITG